MRLCIVIIVCSLVFYSGVLLKKESKVIKMSFLPTYVLVLIY